MSVSSGSSPIFLLNDDDLLSIFESGTTENTVGYKANHSPTFVVPLKWAVKLSHVCRYWRTLAINHPSLWGDIFSHHNPRWLPLQLERSKSASLAVTWRSSDVSLYNLALFLQQQIERIKELNLDLTPRQINELFPPKSKLRAPLLMKLRIRCPSDASQSTKEQSVHNLVESGDLYDLYLEGVCPLWTLHAAKQPYLTRLYVGYRSWELKQHPTVQLDTLLDLFAALPRLECVDLAGAVGALEHAGGYDDSVLDTDDDELSFKTKPQRRLIQMPSLRLLSIRRLPNLASAVELSRSLTLHPTCAIRYSCRIGFTTLPIPTLLQKILPAGVQSNLVEELCLTSDEDVLCIHTAPFGKLRNMTGLEIGVLPDVDIGYIALYECDTDRPEICRSLRSLYGTCQLRTLAIASDYVTTEEWTRYLGHEVPLLEQLELGLLGAQALRAFVALHDELLAQPQTTPSLDPVPELTQRPPLPLCKLHTVIIEFSLTEEEARHLAAVLKRRAEWKNHVQILRVGNNRTDFERLFLDIRKGESIVCNLHIESPAEN